MESDRLLYSDLLLKMGGGTAVFGVDLDGSTERMSKTSPSNLDLNEANQITDLTKNSTFEDGSTNWATGGTHVMSVDTGSKLTGTNSGKIVASGVGDSSTNFASLASNKFTTIVSGKKYTFQMQVRADLADTDVEIEIGNATDAIELVTNGDFETNTDWSLGTGWSIDTDINKAVAVATTGNLIETDAFSGIAVGSLIKVVWTISDYVGGSVRSEVGGTLNGSKSSNGTFTEYTVLGGTNIQLHFDAQTSFTGKISAVSAEKVGKTFTAVDQSSEILVWNFEAGADAVGEPIQIYLSQADTVYIDQVDISVSYDMTISVWTKLNASSAIEGIIYYRASHWYSLFIASNSKVQVNIYDGKTELTRTTLSVVDDAVWYFFTATYDRTGNLSLYQDGVFQDATVDITGIGAVRPATTLRIGNDFNGNNELNGLLGEIQIIRGQVLTAGEILTAYNRGRAGKNFLETGNEVAWYKFKGGTNAKFLSDETGNNNLTGVNVTQADDQVKVGKYK